MDSSILSTTIEHMKEWLLDCFPDEQEDIQDASYDQLKRAIQCHYEGGLPAFLLTVI